MIAVREAYQAGLLRRGQWLPNIVAGSIVGIVALPLAMAFAIATGARPEQGIYTAIIAALVVSLFGGSRLQIAGPTGAFVVILASIVNTHGIEGLQLATMMAGVILVLMGIFRLGVILRFIPAPVIVGFTAGIGVVIWVGQWASFFGLPALEGEHVHEKIASFFHQLDAIDPATTILALTGLIIVIYAPRLTYLHRIPSPLIAMVIITLIQVIVGFDSVATIGSTFGGIPLGLPAFAPPTISLDAILDLLGPAFTIALLGAIESLLSAVVADGMAGTRHDSNQELKGQGLANVAVACFGGIAATGAIARTATNIRNGATSPLAGVTHSLVLLAIILVLAPLASSIPLAVLAAILFVVAWNMSEVRHVIRMIRRAPVADVAILLITFVLTIAADLVIAVNVGVLLATVHFLHRMASSVEVRRSDHEVAPQDLPADVAVYSIEGPFFFAAVESFEHALAQTHTDPKAIIIRLGSVPFVDITGIETLREVREDFEQRGVRVVFTEANQQVVERLLRGGVIVQGDGSNYTAEISSALALIGESQE
ncbi:MAG TPA: SulP family inorganic anion transporter [Thermomicrobiales bacterium]|nr:SulP family inorganic anion transporter [Thermomicrobiales bacterium]